jgi:hypothetical protein
MWVVADRPTFDREASQDQRGTSKLASGRDPTRRAHAGAVTGQRESQASTPPGRERGQTDRTRGLR